MCVEALKAERDTLSPKDVNLRRSDADSISVGLGCLNKSSEVADVAVGSTLYRRSSGTSGGSIADKKAILDFGRQC